MFFLGRSEKKESKLLYQCGLEIPKKEKIFPFIEKNWKVFSSEWKEKQRQMELFSFGEDKTLSSRKEAIVSYLQAFLRKENLSGEEKVWS
jgi:hypothetical protein